MGVTVGRDEAVAVPIAPAPPSRTRASWRAFRRHWIVYVLGVVAPVLLFLAFVGFPLVYTVYLSFVDWGGLRDPEFVGLRNFRDLLGDRVFRAAFVNTMTWIVFTVFGINVVAFLVAVALRSGRILFPGLMRLLIFLPQTMSLVAVGLMFAFILDPSFGAVEAILGAVGLEHLTPNLFDTSKVLYTLIAVFGWAYMGMSLLLFDAALTQIPSELYESARLDGAGGMQMMRHVTIPSLRPTFLVVTMLGVINAVIVFDIVLVMTAGGPGAASHTLGFYMYRTAFIELRFGYGATVSTVMLFLSIVFAIVYLRRVGRNILDVRE